MVEQGIGTRVTPQNLLIFGADGPLDNTLRFDNECARHISHVHEIPLLRAVANDADTLHFRVHFLDQIVHNLFSLTRSVYREQAQ